MRERRPARRPAALPPRLHAADRAPRMDTLRFARRKKMRFGLPLRAARPAGDDMCMHDAAPIHLSVRK
jgi:hypothetical protein